MAVNIGPKIGIDGEAKYRQQINNIIQQAKLLDSEMKAVTSSFTQNATAQEKLTAKSEVLAKQVDNQREKVSMLTSYWERARTKQYELSVELHKATVEFGSNSKEATAAEKAYNSAEQTTTKLKTQLNLATAELNKMENELAKGGGAAGKMSDATQDLDKSLDDAKNTAATFGDVLKANILSDAIINGVKQLANGFLSLAKMGISYNMQMETYQTNFATLLGDADKAKQLMAEVQAYAQKTSFDTPGLADAAQMLLTVGYNVDDVMPMLKMLGDVSLGDADRMNSLALAMSQVTSAGKLQGQDLNQLINAGWNPLQEISEMTGQSMAELKDEMSKGAISADMVAEALQHATSEGGKFYKAVENGGQTLHGKLGNLEETFQSHFGQAFEGASEQLKAGIDKVSEMLDKIDWESIGAAIGDIAGKIMDFGLWLLDNGDTVVSLVAGIGAAFVAWNVGSTILGLVKAIKAFQQANEFATVAQAALNAIMAANPVGLVIVGISALVAAVVAFIATNDDAKAFIANAWNTIKTTISNVIDGVVQKFDEFRLNVCNKAREIGTWIINGISGAVEYLRSLASQALGWGADFIDGFIRGFTSKIGSLVKGVKGIGSTIASYLHFSRPDKGPLRDYEQWMPDMLAGMARGIRDSQYLVEDAMSGVAGGMVSNMDTNNYNYGGVTVKVYAAPGQDVNAVADAVMQKINRATMTKAGAY